MRDRCSADSDGDRATSRLTEARESLVFTDCPPGPLERENRHSSSDPGIERAPLTCRSGSATSPACR